MKSKKETKKKTKKIEAEENKAVAIVKSLINKPTNFYTSVTFTYLILKDVSSWYRLKSEHKLEIANGQTVIYSKDEVEEARQLKELRRQYPAVEIVSTERLSKV